MLLIFFLQLCFCVFIPQSDFHAFYLICNMVGYMVGHMVGIVISFLIIRPTKNGREVIILHKFGLMQTIAFILHKNYDFSIFIPLHAL